MECWIATAAAFVFTLASWFFFWRTQRRNENVMNAQAAIIGDTRSALTSITEIVLRPGLDDADRKDAVHTVLDEMAGKW